MNNTQIDSSKDIQAVFRKANDPDTPTDVLIELSNSTNEIIRGAIAYNKSTPDHIIDILGNDPSHHVISCLRKRGIKTNPRFIKPIRLIGQNLIFQNASKDDASFILELRTNAKKSQHISQTPPDLNKQISWLESYENDNSQVYFVVLNKDHERVGTVRLYDQKGNSFCWGSWILKEGCPSSFSIESALIVYQFALGLGFENAHFDVRKGNKSVWQFHERFGAIRTEETDLDYIYTISQEAIQKSLVKYDKYLPHGISVDF